MPGRLKQLELAALEYAGQLNAPTPDSPQDPLPSATASPSGFQEVLSPAARVGFENLGITGGSGSSTGSPSATAASLRG